MKTSARRQLAAVFAAALMVMGALAPSPQGARADAFSPVAEIAALESAAAALRRMEMAGPWPVIPEGTALALGGEDARVPTLRKRLDLPGDSTVFDEALDTAVRLFQVRNGLEADGVIGARTLAALNVPISQRIRQIELNIRRWQAMPVEPAPRFILVSVPFMELQAVNAGQVEFTTRVVVGTPKWQTPLFRSEIQAAVFLPYWNVPASIVRDEILPRLERDPDYLVRNRMEGVGDTGVAYRQLPGPGNSLGLVKFDMPNVHDVYLHDTPSKRLFARARRDFSHGCVRVQNPELLAAWVMSDMPQWNPEAIRTAMARTTPMRVRLATPVPVRTAYLTARATADGGVEFRADIYGLDAAGWIGYPEASLATCPGGCSES